MFQLIINRHTVDAEHSIEVLYYIEYADAIDDMEHRRDDLIAEANLMDWSIECRETPELPLMQLCLDDTDDDRDIDQDVRIIRACRCEDDDIIEGFIIEEDATTHPEDCLCDDCVDLDLLEGIAPLNR